MKLTTSRKVYLGILGLAIVVFAGDRILSGDSLAPRSIQASQSPASPLTSEPAGQASTPAGLASSSISVADQLEALSVGPKAVSKVPEAFIPDNSWIAQNQAGPAMAAPDLAKKFAETHQLMSVMTSSEGGRAVVDDKVVRVGQKFDGFMLVRVTKRSASFRSGHLQVDLKIQVPGK